MDDVIQSGVSMNGSEVEYETSLDTGIFSVIHPTILYNYYVLSRMEKDWRTLLWSTIFRNRSSKTEVGGDFHLECLILLLLY